MSKVDFHLLRQKIKEAARLVFDDYQRAHADETFYAFALYSDDGAMTVCPAANTEPGYERCVKRYQANESMMKFLAEHGISWESSLSNYRWGTAEWAYSGDRRKHFRRVCEINDVDSVNDSPDEEFIEYRAQLFASMVLGLGDLDADGYFGHGEARSRVTLLCSITDSSNAVWLEYESAHRLNPPQVFDAFWTQRMMDKSVAADFSKHQRRPGDCYLGFMKLLG